MISPPPPSTIRARPPTRINPPRSYPTLQPLPTAPPPDAEALNNTVAALRLFREKVKEEHHQRWMERRAQRWKGKQDRGGPLFSDKNGNGGDHSKGGDKGDERGVPVEANKVNTFEDDDGGVIEIRAAGAAKKSAEILDAPKVAGIAGDAGGFVPEAVVVKPKDGGMFLPRHMRLKNKDMGAEEKAYLRAQAGQVSGWGDVEDGDD